MFLLRRCPEHIASFVRNVLVSSREAHLSTLYERIQLQTSLPCDSELVSSAEAFPPPANVTASGCMIHWHLPVNFRTMLVDDCFSRGEREAKVCNILCFLHRKVSCVIVTGGSCRGSCLHSPTSLN
ncbi:hypothetical protein CGCF413_v015608 [Colletotrichum fructicola]|nr:hypothetical protein CGCF413_v015608 [Colletotrichum fructicola]